MNTYDPLKRKYVKIGSVKDGVLYKNVLPKHFFRLVNGYGIQYDAFNQIIPQIKKIVIKEQNGNQWTSEPVDWMVNGKVMDFKHGKQIFLSLKFMKLTKTRVNADLQPEMNLDIKSRLSEEFFRKYPELRKVHGG